MPYVNCLTSVSTDRTGEDSFKAGAAKALAEVAGKPERYLFVAVQGGQPLYLAGERKPGAVLEVKLVGSLTRAQKKELTSRFCDLCRESFGLSGEAVYVIIQEVAGENWGWNGATFG